MFYLRVGLEASLKRSAGNDPDKFDAESTDFWKRIVPGYFILKDFLRVVSPETKIIQIDDPEGKMNIEETGHLHEGRILRDRQV